MSAELNKPGINYGLIRLALDLLVKDRAKFSSLILGITFAVFLMTQMMSMFAGVLQRTSATITNVGASIWVMDPTVDTVQNSIPLPDYVLDAVRSVDGVRYAVPILTGGALVKLNNGAYQSVSVVGLDDTSLYGRPALEKGNISDIYAENGFIAVDDAEYGKLGSPDVGAEFAMNDHRAVVVGVAKVASGGLFGIPTLYTTISRAVQYIPSSRFTTSYVLVEPKTAADVPRIQAAVRKLGYLALTKQEFKDRTASFYEYKTGMGMNILLMTVISFVVGLSVSGQTFYAFVVENLDKFGALKAIGAQGRELVGMILLQSLFTCMLGYGLGVGICALVIILARLRMPDYAAVITFWTMGISLVMVAIIAAFSSFIASRRVLKIDPYDIFRG
jgi:putative ABC transport system permease protein